MTLPGLAAAFAKLEWGDHYLHALSPEVRKWGDPNSDPVVTGKWEEYPEKRFTLVPFESFAPTPREWPFLIGDIVSNYRAALNYAAYELVRVGRTPAKCDGIGVQFPIGDPVEHPHATVATFHKWVQEKQLPGVLVKYVRTISPFQPYASRRHSRWPLDALRVLSNRDKHRRPLLMTRIHRIAITGAISEPRKDETGTPFIPFKITPLRGRFTPKPGTYIARLDWAPGFRPVPRRFDLNPFASDQADVGVNLQITGRVTLQDYGAREVLVTLEGISDIAWKTLRALDAV